VNDIADYERFVEVASGTLLMYKLGATAGLLIASDLMGATRDMAMLFAYAATLHLALALFCIWRLMRLQRPLVAERPTFVVTMPRTAPMPPSPDPRAEEGAEVVGGEEPVGEGTHAGRPARERRGTVP
jgi:hypothetical protein